MNRIGPEQFLQRREEFDLRVADTPEVATFCSQSSWQRAAIDHLSSGFDVGERFIIEEEGAWLLFAERRGTGVLYPWESSWMFGCPLVGDPSHSVDLLWRFAGQVFPRKVGFCIGGVRRNGCLQHELEARRPGCRDGQEFPGTDCMIIDLSDGFEAWWNRRSRKFRRSMRQRGIAEGLEIEDASGAPVPELLERILSLQKKTCKWKEGTDIFLHGEYRRFYACLMEDLQARRSLRVIFAREDGRDIAFQMGGLHGDGYRGLQMSYVEEARSLGVGNWLQLENLKRCAAEGVREYDLGMHSPYKERWADRRDEYRVLFLVP